MKKSNGYSVHVRDEDVFVDKDYDPLQDSGQYMNKIQLAFFKNTLLKWKAEMQEKIAETVKEIGTVDVGDKSSEEGDLANDEASILTKLRTRDRHRKLIHKIDNAILKIETGAYGYCEKSGEEIGIKRLLARPIANLSIEMQRIHEHDEDVMEDSEHSHRLLQIEDELLSDEETEKQSNAIKASKTDNSDNDNNL